MHLRVEEKVLPSHRMIDLHITLDGVNAVIYWFWGHPFQRELLRILSTVHVLVDFSHQPKVWHFDSVITANQNITSCKVTMNEAFLCEMILKNHERNKKAQFIYRNNDYNTFVFFFVSHVFNLVMGVWNYQQVRHPSQTFRFGFINWVDNVNWTPNLFTVAYSHYQLSW